jgi:hypothetical protein
MRPTLCGACGLREVKPKWVVGCKRLLLVAWLSSTLDGITPLCTPLRPEGHLGLDLMTAKRRGSIGPSRSALLALCPPSEPRERPALARWALFPYECVAEESARLASVGSQWYAGARAIHSSMPDKACTGE